MKLSDLLDNIKKVHKMYGTSVPYIVGGTARDRYLKHLDNIDDLDFTTGDRTVKVLSAGLYKDLNEQYKVVRKTMDDGHSSIYMGGLKLDFSSNFMNPNIDKELSDLNINNPTPLTKEMYSRDFTCNTLLLDLGLNGMLSPVKTAFKDLDSKIIKTCLAPEITLMNSKNRVVRAIYLASKLGFDIDESIIKFVKENPESINVSSENSVKSKLAKAFEYDANRAAENITKMGLWKHITMSDDMLPYYNVFMRKMRTTNV